MKGKLNEAPFLTDNKQIYQVALTFIFGLYRGKTVVIYRYPLNRTSNGGKAPPRVSTFSTPDCARHDVIAGATDERAELHTIA